MKYETVNTSTFNATNISCGGEEAAIRDCVSTELPVDTVCQLAVVDCNYDIIVTDPEVDNADDDDDVDRERENVGNDDGNEVHLDDETDDPQRKNNSGSGSTGGVIAGVVVTIILILILIVAIVVVLVYLRHRTKQMTVNTKQVCINQMYESQDACQGGGKTHIIGNGEKHLDNPVYGLGNNHQAPTHKDPDEHHLMNPLYYLAEADRPQPAIDIYADDPEYAVPDRKTQNPQSASNTHTTTGEPAYAYAYAETV